MERGRLTAEPRENRTLVPKSGTYTGSVSCRECHEKFYKLWAPSHHGLAMQPYTAEFARTRLDAQTADIVVGKYGYRADIGVGAGWVREQGPDGEKKYSIAHALGGKNVYYFLTPMDRGRLQVLPVAFDVRKKKWFNTTASMVRHFTDLRDEAVDWKDPALTFNTSCYGCHVSQVSTNYDVKTDTYHTTWTEPGINCETCHGPAEEHIRVCKEAPKGTIPKDLKITRGGRDFTVEQNNTACAPCHAKMMPLTETFQPGDRFFDHYDLVTLENRDFYPDGRDLGENYTYTLWRMSPCAKSGKLSCLHCHTSSGRYRFKGEKTNNACMPCHKKHVSNPTAHTHHKADSTGNKCVACHMPTTEFARMRRSDHSMLPPTPAATIEFKSPNACDRCHKDKTTQWSDKWVRKWRSRDYQARILHRAGLIDAAGKRDWKKLPEMLAYITSKDRDEVYATSLIRLLQACNHESKWPVILKALKDPSPLVRSAAAAALAPNLTPETGAALLKATEDDYRVVRVQAGVALAGYPRKFLSEKDRKRLKRASDEYEASQQSRPDDWRSYYNLGNYFLNRRELQFAVSSFEKAAEIRPDNILPLVNASIAYARFGDGSKAEGALHRALKIDPANAEANFNLGLLKAEQGDLSRAEKCFRTALKSDPKPAAAAFNLGVLLAKDRIGEAIQWCRKAHELHPGNPKYAFTLAFYLRKEGKTNDAVEILRDIVGKQRANADSYMLLGEIYQKQGKKNEAAALYRQAVNDNRLPTRARLLFGAKLRALSSAGGVK